MAGGRGQRALGGVEGDGEVSRILRAYFVHGVSDDGDARHVIGRVVQNHAVVGGGVGHGDGAGRRGHGGWVAVHPKAKVVFRAGHFGTNLTLQPQAQATARAVGDGDIGLQGRGLGKAAHNGNGGGPAEGDALQPAGLRRSRTQYESGGE